MLMKNINQTDEAVAERFTPEEVKAYVSVLKDKYDDIIYALHYPLMGPKATLGQRTDVSLFISDLTVLKLDYIHPTSKFIEEILSNIKKFWPTMHRVITRTARSLSVLPTPPARRRRRYTQSTE